MKRGKDDEKMMGPMFPRLHVNDTDRGGPRAPPRNKMALYEQLSIPSQRFNPGVVPNNSSSKTPATSSTQGSGLERTYHLPHRVPPSTAASEQSYSRQPDRGNSNSSLAQVEQQKNVGDEDDFTVPVFDNSGTGHYHSGTQIVSDREKLDRFSPTYSSRSLKTQTAGDNDPKHIGSTGVHLRQDMKNPREENLEACLSSRNNSERSSTNVPVRGKMSEAEDKATTAQNQQLRDNAQANFSKLLEYDVCLRQEAAAPDQPNSYCQGDDVPEQSRETKKVNVPWPVSDSSSVKDQASSKKPGLVSEKDGDKKLGSMRLENADKSNDFSEASVLDSIIALDISPDDVVGIIGQKHFWKARRAIANQQRVFGVQVFELHRLIKVQRLIAGSPHLLLEDSTFIGKQSRNVSPTENLTSECVVTPPEHTAKRKLDSFEKPNHKMECSAENAIAKTSLSSVKNGRQLSNLGSYSGNPTSISVAADAKMNPWYFNQSMGQQWLMPVISPSEGLIYKPYTVPEYMGSGYGGCGPFGPISMTGNFMNASYGVPPLHHHHHHLHQGIGGLPGAPPVGHGYFPPHAMPFMNPVTPGPATEQINHFPGSGSNGQTGHYFAGSDSNDQTGQSPLDKTNFDLQHQTTRNVMTQKSRTVSQVRKFQVSKDHERQGSSGSSPSERAPGVGTARTTGGRDALAPFPAPAAASEGASQPQETDLPTRVIKVVPHNRRSATASAARIFQSIQEGRKQFDSV